MADEAGASPSQDKVSNKKNAKKLEEQQLHQQLVDETERERKRDKILRVFQKKNGRAPAAPEEVASSLAVPEAKKAEEVRDLLKQHRMEVEPLWDRDAEEEWFRDDPPVTPGATNEAGHAQESAPEPAIPRPAPTDNFVSMYGVHIDNFWVGTSRAMLAIVYALVAALSGVVLWQMIEKQTERHVMGWAIGAVFVGMTVPLSLNDIHMHIIHYVSPLQRHYVRILWMVPIYSVESWLALRFNDQKLVLETMREAYEAFVVYSFFTLMKEFLGPKHVALAKMAKVASLRGRGVAKMLVPCCCLRPWRLDSEFLKKTTMGVWQYVFLRSVVAVLVIVFESQHMYGEGDFSFDKFYVWSILIVNASQCWALYCLILFYFELKEELAPINPLGKFLVVKAVVFFSWWQQIIVTCLATFHLIDPILDYSAEDVAKGYQNLLIVVEMFVYALCHRIVFPYLDFRAGGPLAKYLEETQALRRGASIAITEMLPTDIIQEGIEYVHKGAKHLRHLKDKMRTSQEVDAGRTDAKKSKGDEEAGSEWGPEA